MNDYKTIISIDDNLYVVRWWGIEHEANAGIVHGKNTKVRYVDGDPISINRDRLVWRGVRINVFSNLPTVVGAELCMFTEENEWAGIEDRSIGVNQVTVET